MKDICILSDFDGTITEDDGLYGFFVKYAKEGWQDIEREWKEKKIGSQECLKREFDCVENLSKQLINEYVKTVNIDTYFPDFYKFITEKYIDFYVVSDGADYFINSTFRANNIEGIKIFSNHLKFIDKGFRLKFPNEDKECETKAGTCKCKIVSDMKKTYKRVFYIGDGYSDFCVANKADKLFAKKRLINYCAQSGLEYFRFDSFKDIIRVIKTII